MKAILCDRPGSLSLIDRPDPAPKPGEALLRIRRIGVCGTDYHILSGNQPFLSYPRVMGHELAAEVVEAPAGSGFAPGDAVVVVPYLSCGTCRACLKGMTNACRRISVLGVHQDGGMAEFLSVPVGNLIAAGSLSLDQAAMVEFLAIGAHGVRRGALTAADRVLVVGAGPIGMAAVIFARVRGAEVTAMDMRADRLAFVRETLGAATVVASDTVRDEFEAMTEGEFFDVVIDATGYAPSIGRGLSFVGHGGRYVLLSVVQADIAFADPEFHKRETTLLASRNAQPADFSEVMRQIEAGAVPTAALATHRAPLTDAPAAMPLWSTPQAGVIKALLEV
jgi:2-desacetyl-2-hydroxyethyl bacteriochlorophyllide A dehydrogenase